MSSVVNKSKGKFAPKPKARARPGAVSTTSPSAPESSTLPSPSAVSESAAPSQTLEQPSPQLKEPQQQVERVILAANSSPVLPQNIPPSSARIEERVPAVIQSPQPQPPQAPREAPKFSTATVILAPGARKPTPIAIPGSRRDEGELPRSRTASVTPVSAVLAGSVEPEREASGPVEPVTATDGDPPTAEAEESEAQAVSAGVNLESGSNQTTPKSSAKKSAPKPKTQKVSKPRAPRKRKTAPTATDAPTEEGAQEAGEASAVNERPKRRRVVRKQPVDEPVDEDEAGENGEGFGQEEIDVDDDQDEDFEASEGEEQSKTKKSKAKTPRTLKTPAKPRQPRKPKKEKPEGRVGFLGVEKTRPRREESPENDGDRRLEESKVLMKDLCRDPQIGRKSKRFIELAEMDWNDVVKKQRELQEKVNRGEAHVETAEERMARIAAGKDLQRSRTGNHSAPQMRIVNGELVIDEETLRVDRHERDALQTDEMEIVEENTNTRLINSNTFSKRERTERWDPTEIALFYEGLSMFGTDFTMLAGLFPTRTRRQIKNKFNVEERKNPLRITQALRQRVPVDMTSYSTVTSIEFPDPQQLEGELQALRNAHEKQMELHKEHIIAAEKERQEQANAAMHEVLNAEQNGDVQPKGKRKKGKKDQPVRGEQIIEMSIEEYEAERKRREEEDAW
ncbi:hypothetical protein EX30DRAFT_392720 [Ascodesmis nigricans]|uniref:Myb-like domain-containing protein n=1 Tax=Ascodesmis nigricans TaxID=341454 RepID=A0A4S2N7N1_9PEZI|nr:hypothetical protein EX30DRAFT_392720 [Ascodesmis nigricans]